jgi:hypothetical protein
MTYSLKYVVITKEDILERKKDTSWHHYHEMLKGYLWKRYSDDAEISVYELCRRGIAYDEWLHISEEERETIVKEVKIKQEARREELEKNPIKIGGFQDFAFPISNFPTNPINDLVGVQPMLGSN